MIIRKLNEDKRIISSVEGRYEHIGGQRGRLFSLEKIEPAKEKTNEPSKV